MKPASKQDQLRDYPEVSKEVAKSCELFTRTGIRLEVQLSAHRKSILAGAVQSRRAAQKIAKMRGIPWITADMVRAPSHLTMVYEIIIPRQKRTEKVVALLLLQATDEVKDVTAIGSFANNEDVRYTSTQKEYRFYMHSDRWERFRTEDTLSSNWKGLMRT